MAQQNRTTLKGYFNTGDTPTEAQFIDLIDSQHNIAEDGTPLTAADLAPVTGTGTTILLDKLSGRIYNRDAPSSSASITIDLTGAVAGATAQFVSDGTEVTSITCSATVYIGGAQNTGSQGAAFVYYDGADVYLNWVPSAAGASTPQLTTPTLTLVAGDTELDYTLGSVDANATGGAFEISTDNATWSAVSGWSFGTTTGTITGLSNGTLYYLRFKVTASGYTDSAYATDSETPNVVVSYTPVAFTVTATLPESPTGVYTGTSASNYAANYGISTTSYAGDFDFAIEVDEADSVSSMFGISTTNTNREWNNATPWDVAVFIQSSNNTLSIAVSGGSLADPTNDPTLTYTAGDLLRLVRVSNNVKLYYNAIEAHDFGTVSGTIYLHISQQNTKKIYNPKVNA